MKLYWSSVSCSLLLIAVFGFFIMPLHTEACTPASPCVVSDTSLTTVKTMVESTVSAIQNTITAVAQPIQTAALVAQEVNTYVLQPLAFVLSGNLMKMLTAGVVQFVIGKANGTGMPQFVVDVMQTMQTVGDSQALAYLNQFGRNSNSPFASSISSALRTNYLSKTSLAGFWAANMNTLARSSPNVPAFLAGNWSQGGVAAWFALTTQVQNNPYTFYQASQSQMSALVGPGIGGATGARLAQLGWGQGFMSWCGATDPSTSSTLGTSYNSAQAANAAYGDAYDAAAAEPGNQALQDAAAAAKAAADAANAKTTSAINSTSGINPGDPCSNKDGTPGQIRTPGSTIKATLDKVLGGQQDQITRMGNVGPQINQILGNIGTVLQTVNFATELLGGPGSGGLFGIDQPSGSNSTSRLMQYAPTQNSSGDFTSGYLGATQASVLQGAATIASSGSGIEGRIAQYEPAWNTIGAATQSASTTVADLANSCAGQASVAQVARTNVIQPMLNRVASAASAVVAARAMMLKVQNTATTSSTYITDMQTLQSMSPTMSDVANALQDSQVFTTAVASPLGSLNVSGGSLVDQMNLISTNAAALKAACSPSAVEDLGGSSTGD